MLRYKLYEMSDNKKQVILVSIGSFQSYITNNIDQLLQFDFNIHVIIDNHFNVIHLENDVLLYNDMNYNFDEKLYITMDSKDRCIPGIMYIPNHELFNKLIENYNYSKNDMENLGIFFNNNRNIVNAFPIIDNSVGKTMYNEHFEKFNGIFDGAAIGQYLGGVDPRNISGDTRGFVNETCVIKYDKYKFKWLKKGSHYFPHIEINNAMIPIHNLHIHSKTLEKFSMNDPIENKFITRTSTSTL